MQQTHYYKYYHHQLFIYQFRKDLMNKIIFLALKYTEYVRHLNVHTIFLSKLLRGYFNRILFMTDNLSAYLIV